MIDMTGYERINILFHRINYSEPIIICCSSAFCWIFNFCCSPLDVDHLVVSLRACLFQFVSFFFRASCNLKPVTIAKHVSFSIRWCCCCYWMKWNVTVKYNFTIFQCEFHRKVLVCDSSIWIWWVESPFSVHTLHTIILVWTKPNCTSHRCYGGLCAWAHTPFS